MIPVELLVEPELPRKQLPELLAPYVAVRDHDLEPDPVTLRSQLTCALELYQLQFDLPLRDQLALSSG